MTESKTVPAPEPHASLNPRSRILLYPMLGFALALRLGALAILYHDDPSRMMGIDSSGYEQPALALLQTGHFARGPQTPNEPETIRTPGYPLLIAALYAVFGERQLAVLIFQVLMSIATVMLAFVIARRLGSTRSALVTVAILCLDSASLRSSNWIMTETLFTAVLMLGLTAGVFYLTGGRKKPSLLFWMGLAFAFSAWVRPISYYLVFVLLIFFGAVHGIGGWRWKGTLLILTLIAGPWLVLVGGWRIRNFHATGSSKFSLIEDANLFLMRAAGIVALNDGVGLPEAQRRLFAKLPSTQGLSVTELCELYGVEGRKIIKEHPGLFVKTMVRGLARMMSAAGEVSNIKAVFSIEKNIGPRTDLFRLSFRKYARKWFHDEIGLFLIFVFATVYLGLLYLGVVAGLWSLKGLPPSLLAAHGLVWTLMLYLLVLSSGPEATIRFRVPVMPLLAIHAGQGLTHLGGAAASLIRRVSSRA